MLRRKVLIQGVVIHPPTHMIHPPTHMWVPLTHPQGSGWVSKSPLKTVILLDKLPTHPHQSSS
jgi:hypothetical protein